ncbi:MAG: hypothetical protein OQL19_17995 [Gammaproteobacteria bacterium]|nr:hypothetical protein [Gammaproteobacteria bacterium]
MKGKIIICKVTWFVTFIFIMVASHTAHSINQPNNNYQALSENIQALDTTRRKTQEALSNLDLNQDKSTLLHNQKEYSVFIEYLSHRINEYCTQIAEQYGEKFLKDLPCSKNGTLSKPLDNNTYVTSDEKVESLDDELMNALGDFDEMLLEEDEKIAQTSQTRMTEQASSSASGSEKSSDNNEQNESRSKNESENRKSSTTQSNSKSSRQSKGKGKQSSSSREYKRKKLDNIDDDIVSRQLKEAAEKETDPELKEKLWDEYYRYKQNTIK